MKKSTKILWGIALVAAGVIYALNALEITNIDIFFDGWWTLLLIVPCTVGLFTEKKKSGNLLGIVVGGLLLLCAQNILSYDLLWKLALPAIVVIAGLKLLFSGVFGKRKRPSLEVEINIADDNNIAIFGSREIRYAGRPFTGTTLTCIFGGIDCDLTGAIIDRDCVIDVSCIFGGIDLRVPPSVNIRTDVACIFGGVDNTAHPNPAGPTVYVKGACIFGGMDIL